MMNERIKELAEQAHKYANKQVEGTGLNVLDMFKEKFAELIALECAELMEKQHSWITNIAASKLIRQHFGVEE
jgi:hypothetical protein